MAVVARAGTAPGLSVLGSPTPGPDTAGTAQRSRTAAGWLSCLLGGKKGLRHELSVPAKPRCFTSYVCKQAQSSAGEVSPGSDRGLLAEGSLPTPACPVPIQGANFSN